ncbi:carcinoembryonic antigen-related cell adhesion molecule 20-like [Erpetoichthys calabaricus]|uniref:carcinoembryonic antigen-related cell adhesion molecule 20-like n=1 Tax=Erpetoichthys calabaricus TaxID=27687 RepID=UPI0022346863|nr:carcinoembryonic antigen-related cell adhesion molecule 20-like [Erpetoichthys calabaricus]
MVYHTDGQRVSSSHRHRVHFLESKNKTCSVEIRNVSREESGYYKFRYEGPGENDRWTQVPGVKVTVTGLKVEATAEKVKENDAVTLTCRTNCSLNNISWFRSGRRLYKTSETLDIQRASYKDHGNYSCRARHLTSPEFHMNVEYSPKNAVITGQPTITIEEGTSVTLKCTALANPPCNFTWVKENSSHVETGEQLHIREFKESHAGSYHCKATNIHGTAKSAGVTLKVQGEHQQCIMG